MLQRFKPLDWFHIKNRGWAVVVRNPADFEFGKSPLLNAEVEIEGFTRPIKVLGVESNATPVIRKNAKISLLTDADPRAC